jgi:pimeloyl-ACP methyl ester carboxylesterase
MLDLLLKIIAFVITIIIISILIIKRFVYFKPNESFTNVPNNYEEITDGSLFGWLLHGSSDKSILFCHGNTGNISHRTNKISILQSLGYTVLIFDYTGYGKSKGVPTEQQCYQDTSIFMNILLKKFNKKNITIYGESLGAPIATRTALQFQINTLVLESPLPSIKKYIKYKYPYLSFFTFLFPEFNTEQYLDSYKGRTLVLHSIDDDIISYESTHTLRFKSNFIQMSGTHNNPVIPWNDVHNFISE